MGVMKMGVYQNQGASCITCTWQEGALIGDVNSKYQCKKCRNKKSCPGWEPKPGTNIIYSRVAGAGGKIVSIRKVIE